MGKIFSSNKDRWKVVDNLIKGYQEEHNIEAIEKLWKMYLPMINKSIGNWKKHFNDTNNKIIEYDDLCQELFIWFEHYVMNYKFGKSEIGKQATFSTYISTHINARIRYIYQRAVIIHNNEKPIELLPSEGYNEKLDALVSLVVGLQASAEEEVLEAFDRAEANLLGAVIINRYNKCKTVNDYREAIKNDGDMLDVLYNFGYNVDSLFEGEGL